MREEQEKELGEGVNIMEMHCTNKNDPALIFFFFGTSVPVFSLLGSMSKGCWDGMHSFTFETQISNWSSKTTATAHVSKALYQALVGDSEVHIPRQSW